ncbi:hypothetical protein FOA52_009663 [Chlamydomonas sp. UWO 241]|nr:hypothetical protein FOA52_009663 [Chlamydomonas sp. UWO 241]
MSARVRVAAHMRIGGRTLSAALLPPSSAVVRRPGTANQNPLCDAKLGVVRVLLAKQPRSQRVTLPCALPPTAWLGAVAGGSYAGLAAGAPAVAVAALLALVYTTLAQQQRSSSSSSSQPRPELPRGPLASGGSESGDEEAMRDGAPAVGFTRMTAIDMSRYLDLVERSRMNASWRREANSMIARLAAGHVVLAVKDCKPRLLAYLRNRTRAGADAVGASVDPLAALVCEQMGCPLPTAGGSGADGSGHGRSSLGTAPGRWLDPAGRNCAVAASASVPAAPAAPAAAAAPAAPAAPAPMSASEAAMVEALARVVAARSAAEQIDALIHAVRRASAPSGGVASPKRRRHRSDGGGGSGGGGGSSRRGRMLMSTEASVDDAV